MEEEASFERGSVVIVRNRPGYETTGETYSMFSTYFESNFTLLESVCVSLSAQQFQR